MKWWAGKAIRVLWMAVWIPGNMVLAMRIWGGLKEVDPVTAVAAVVVCISMAIICIADDFEKLFGPKEDEDAPEEPEISGISRVSVSPGEAIYCLPDGTDVTLADGVRGKLASTTGHTMLVDVVEAAAQTEQAA